MIWSNRSAKLNLYSFSPSLPLFLQLSLSQSLSLTPALAASLSLPPFWLALIFPPLSAEQRSSLTKEEKEVINLPKQNFV